VVSMKIEKGLQGEQVRGGKSKKGTALGGRTTDPKREGGKEVYIPVPGVARAPEAVLAVP